MTEHPQSMIDHTAYEASIRQEILKSSLRARLEAVASYHLGAAPYAAQLHRILEDTRFYPDLLTPDAKKAIQFLEQKILEHYAGTFGVQPSWPRYPGQYPDL